MNCVQLVGRLVRDWDLKHLDSGNVVAKNTVAVNRSFAKDNQQQSDFINITVWGKRAKVMSQYTEKGQQVAVSGELRIDQSEKDGHKNYFTNVNVNNFTFIGNKSSTDDAELIPGTVVDFKDGDIPF